MSAKQQLFAKMEFLGAAVLDPVAMDNGIGPNLHNGKANLFRKGLGIMSFNILEDYIKERTKEALEQIAQSGIVFSNLPDKLIECSLLNPLSAIQAVAKRVKKNQDQAWLATVFDSAGDIASPKYSDTNYRLSQYTFFHSSSNIDADQIGEVLTSFGVDGQWPTLTEIAKKVGFGGPDLRQTFVNLSTRRHSAAHESNSIYEYSWLTSIRSDILSIASAFDIALAQRIRLLKRNLGSKAAKVNVLTALKFRYLYPKSPLILQEKISLSAKAKKNWSNESAAMTALLPQCASNDEFLIVYWINPVNSQPEIKDWHS